MPATVRADWYGGAGSEPAGSTAETGITFTREDSKAGTTNPVPIPTATGTNYSWLKNLALNVTTGAATTISNRTVKLASAITSGLLIAFKGTSTYAQPAVGNKPADSGSAGPAVPATFTAVTTTAQAYHATGVSASSTGRNGDFCQLVFGVDNSYAGGGGSASLPNLQLGYDEA